MKIHLKSLLISLSFILSGLLYAQDPSPVLPETDPKSDQETEWTVLHLHNTEKPYDGVQKHFKKTTVDKSTESFPSDNDLLAAKFDRYLSRNKDEFKKKNLSLLRFVMDKENNFNSEQKELLAQVAKKNGFKIRFETVKIDWEARRKKLANAGEEIIEESVPEELKKDKEVSVEIKKTKKGFRKFWDDIYETPTRSEVYGGVTKGVITMALTMSAWAAMGLDAAYAMFWVLTAEHILQEIFFGPYIKTYVNFLYKKIKKKAGDLGVTLWGNVQGFVLFSFDKYLIYTAGFGTPPWDPAYLAGYFGMATIGSALGGFMPIGVFKLIQKGYTNRSTGMLSMQAMDLVMPLEGALLAFDSPYLIWVFSIHQALKFGIYVAGVTAKQKGTLIMMPSEVYETDEAKAYLDLGALPNSDLFRSSEKTMEFLKNESIPMGLKVNFTRYISDIFKNDAELIDDNPEFKKMLKDIVETTALYIGEERPKIREELNANSKKAGFGAMFHNENGEFDLGYSFRSLSHFWGTANQAAKGSSYAGKLKKRLRAINNMSNMLSLIPYNEYDISISVPVAEIIYGDLIQEDIFNNDAASNTVEPSLNMFKYSPAIYDYSKHTISANVLNALAARTGLSSSNIDEQLDALLKLWAQSEGKLTEVDRDLCFGASDEETGIYEYLCYMIDSGQIKATDDMRAFLVISGALFTKASEISELYMPRIDLRFISNTYKDLGLVSIGEMPGYLERTFNMTMDIKGFDAYLVRIKSGFSTIIKK